MKLYHGTSAKNLEKILSQGLKPRGRRKGNWQEFPSRSDMVYLTTAYAPFFALQSGSDKGLIIEVDCELDDLYPDEDFIAQVITKQTKSDLHKVHGEVRKNLEFYKHHAIDSIHGLGNCCHKGCISTHSISRYVLIDFKERSDLVMQFGDPQISLMNYAILGEKYRSTIAWLFSDRTTFQVGIGSNEEELAIREKFAAGSGDYFHKLFQNRQGIDLVELAKAA